MTKINIKNKNEAIINIIFFCVIVVRANIINLLTYGIKLSLW